MTPEPLLAPFAKIEWAETEIDSLKQRIQSFFEENPYRLVSEVNENGTEEVWCFALSKRIPSKIYVSVGSIMHNLRSPLDQLVSAIVLQKHRSPAGVQFPFGRTKQEFERALAGQEKLPRDAIAMIARLEPFEAEGNALLCAIHYINKRISTVRNWFRLI